MRDEEFLLKGRGAMVCVGISLLVIVVAVLWLFLGLGDSPLPCVAVPFGFLALIISLRVMLDDDLGTIEVIKAFWPIRKIVVSGSGIALHRGDNSVASEIVWQEIVNMEYRIKRHMMGRTEVDREPDSLRFILTSARTFEIPLSKILRKKDRGRMVRAVVTHLAVAGYSFEER